MPFHSLSRESSQPRDPSQVSHIAGGFFTIWATKKPHYENGYRLNTNYVIVDQTM